MKFSLKRLLIVVTVLAATLGVAMSYWTSAQRNLQIVSELKSKLAFASYEDGTVPAKSPNFLGTLQARNISVVRNIANDEIAELASGLVGLEEVQLSASVTDKGLRQLAGLSSLERVYIGSANITPEGLEALAESPNLRQLVLVGPSFTDDFLAPVSKIKKLQSLGLTKSKITDEGISQLNGLNQLAELGLASTQVTNEGILILKQLPKLKSIDIYGTDITHGAVAEIIVEHNGGDPSLCFPLSRRGNQPLIIQGKQFADDAAPFLCPMLQNETSLVLDDTRFTAAGLSQFASNIQYLEIRGSDDIKTIDGLLNLEQLTLGDWTYAPIPKLANLPKLNHFSMTVDSVAPPDKVQSLFSFLSTSPTLGSIKLRRHARYENRNEESTGFLEQVTRCASLVQLELTDFPIEDKDVKQFTALGSLRSLKIHGSKIARKGAAQLAKLPSLEHLDLARNQKISRSFIEMLESRNPSIKFTTDTGFAQATDTISRIKAMQAKVEEAK